MRNCRDFFGDDSFLVISGDALTDIDLTRFHARHKEAGGIATLAGKRVEDTREYGVMIHDEDGASWASRRRLPREEALSDLGNCGIYMFEPAIFDYFPERPFVDWAKDVYPALLENDVPFYVHEIDEYWNDVGSLAELRQGTFDALEGKLELEIGGEEIDEGLLAGAGSTMDGITLVEPPVVDRATRRDRAQRAPRGAGRDRRQRDHRRGKRPEGDDRPARHRGAAGEHPHRRHRRPGRHCREPAGRAGETAQAS